MRLGLKKDGIRLADYTSKWKEEFTRNYIGKIVKERLDHKFPNVPYVYHVLDYRI